MDAADRQAAEALRGPRSDEQTPDPRRSSTSSCPARTCGSTCARSERGVARPLRHGRQSVPVVHAAPAVHAALRADDRPAADRRVAVRLPRRQRDARSGRARGGRQELRAAGRAAPGLPPLPRRDDDPRGKAGQPAAPLQPHPVAGGRLVAGAAAGPSSGDLRGTAGERHRRPADRSLRDQLPGLGRGLRARRAGRPVRPPRALARPDDLGARLSDLDRSRGAVPLRARPGGDQATRRADEAARACRQAAADRPRRPPRAVEERAARLPRLRGAAASPAGPAQIGPFPGDPVDQPRERARIRALRERGARGRRPGERHVRSRTRRRSGCSTAPSTRSPSRPCRWPTWSS